MAKVVRDYGMKEANDQSLTCRPRAESAMLPACTGDTMSDPDPTDLKPARKQHNLGASLAFIGAGITLRVIGQTDPHRVPVAYAGLALLAVGIVFFVRSQKGK